MAHVLILRDPSTAKALQTWGPFDSEAGAEAARVRLAAWPTLQGDWEIASMLRLDEPTPPVPQPPVVLPYYPPQYQPLPLYPHWQQPGWVYCAGTNANTQLVTVTPEMQARMTAGSGAVTPPGTWTTFTANTNGVTTWAENATSWTLERIDSLLGDGPNDEDPPAAVAALI